MKAVSDLTDNTQKSTRVNLKGKKNTFNRCKISINIRVTSSLLEISNSHSS